MPHLGKKKRKITRGSWHQPPSSSSFFFFLALTHVRMDQTGQRLRFCVFLGWPGLFLDQTRMILLTFSAVAVLSLTSGVSNLCVEGGWFRGPRRPRPQWPAEGRAVPVPGGAGGPAEGQRRGRHWAPGRLTWSPSSTDAFSSLFFSVSRRSTFCKAKKPTTIRWSMPGTRPSTDYG